MSCLLSNCFKKQLCKQIILPAGSQVFSLAISANSLSSHTHLHWYHAYWHGHLFY
jgi:hypothetical protein